MKIYTTRYPSYPRRVQLIVEHQGVEYAHWYDEPKSCTKAEKEEVLYRNVKHLAQTLGLPGDSEWEFVVASTAGQAQ